MARRNEDIPVFRQRIEILRKRVIRVLPFDDAAACVSGWARAFLANLKPNAQPIGAYDVLLVGQAISEGAVLVSANITEFQRLPMLALENW
jgi:tRNA(fMet)-specific endonuclease VapC